MFGPICTLVISLSPAITLEYVYLFSRSFRYLHRDTVVSVLEFLLQIYDDFDVLSVTLLTRLSLIVADIIVLIVTWIKTFSLFKEASRLGIHMGISETLLRDGMYRVYDFWLLLAKLKPQEVLTLCRIAYYFHEIQMRTFFLHSAILGMNITQIVIQADVCPSDCPCFHA